MQVIICYRDETTLDTLRQQVEDFFCTVHNVQITVCSVKQIKELMEKKTFFCDIFLMNFEKSNKDKCLKIIEDVDKKIPTCQLICYSALGEIGYFPKLFEVNLCYYICVEQLDKLLPSALKKACDALAVQETNCLICKSGYQVMKIPFDDIVFIERDQHTTRIHTIDDCYSIKEKLVELEHLFDKYPAIIRCHMSFFVNCKHCVSFNRKKFETITGASIPISRKYYKEVSEKINERIVNVYNQEIL